MATSFWIELPTENVSGTVNSNIFDSFGNPITSLNGVLLVNEQDANTPKMFNLSAPVADTEVSYLLPANTKKITVSSRLTAQMRLAFNPGETSTNYITLSGGAVYSEDNVDLTGQVLYLRTNKPGNIIEILSWSRI